ncbi:MAG: calcineurin-like phosphoesterase family protein [Proteobacteria bacterium]|nr:calcineurin-like phosphoesterase family protein [Pseudomonadota bacterium]
MKSNVLLMVSALLLAYPAVAKDAKYIGSVHTIPSELSAPSAKGRVFEDTNRNSILDEGEAGIGGVAVSNGWDVVLTDKNGHYELPVYEDMNLFITKPADYATPVNERMVPQFSYIHKVAGSPNLRFGGIEATGPLPKEINFPLIKDEVGNSFECLIFGDAQPYSNQEVSYVRDTVGKMLSNRDNSNTECLIFEGDVMGDDLSLYPRFQEIVSVGKVPQYFVAGNHDLDFDAPSDQHSFDTFRREFGPEYYSFDIGNVHFVVLDDVRYPCNGVDDHSFCDLSKSPTYNGVISDRQLNWLRNDLKVVPKDKLIVLNAHIPFVTYTDASAQKHQVDNLADLYEIIGDRPALGLSGHTHTTEQYLPGEYYDGFEQNTGTAGVKFHQIVTGAVSGSWWAGDLNNSGIPHGTQRLGSPRGYYSIEFDGSEYVDTYMTFEHPAEDQMHASFNTPRFRSWAKQLFAYTEMYGPQSNIIPPVTINDLGDMSMVTLGDLKAGTWVAVNVWNGSKDSKVSISINGGASLEAKRTQQGAGEKPLTGPEFADPFALAKQSTNGRMAFRSYKGGDRTAGYTTWQGTEWKGVPGPFEQWMLTNKSSHLWRVDLPEVLPTGVHSMEIVTTDRYGRTFRETMQFEVVEQIPEMGWNTSHWE